MMIRDALTSPLALLALSLGLFELAKAVSARLHTPLANPLLLSALVLGGLLLLTGTPLDTYESGGSLLTLMLTPATVALAVPIYRRRDTLRRNLLPIFAGTLAGSLVSVGSVFMLSRVLGLNWELLAALLPKSVTTAIALPLADSLGGLTAVTAVAVVFTGIVGAVALPPFLKLIGIRDEVAEGIAIGTASHAVGTSRAIELGETVGAMSSLAIGISGLLTAGILTILSIFLQGAS